MAAAPLRPGATQLSAVSAGRCTVARYLMTRFRQATFPEWGNTATSPLDLLPVCDHSHSYSNPDSASVASLDDLLHIRRTLTWSLLYFSAREPLQALTFFRSLLTSNRHLSAASPLFLGDLFSLKHPTTATFCSAGLGLKLLPPRSRLYDCISMLDIARRSGL